MRDEGEVTVRVGGEDPRDPVYIEVFTGDWMLGVWRAGHRDVWAFALEDKDRVRATVRAELERRGRSL